MVGSAIGEKFFEEFIEFTVFFDKPNFLPLEFELNVFYREFSDAF